MKIDEAVFERAFGPEPSHCSEDRCDWANLRENLATYLAALPALPSAEPGRDRIAVSRFACGMGMARVLEGDEEPDFDEMESVIDMEYGRAARYIVRANCPPPAELVPVEVEGSVEGVGP